MKSISWADEVSKSGKERPEEDSDSHQRKRVDIAQCSVKWHLIKWRLFTRHLGFLLRCLLQLLLIATDPVDDRFPPRHSRPCVAG